MPDNSALLERLNTAVASASPMLRRLSTLSDVWLVGGWLRDACWGVTSDDIDLVAPAPLDGLLAQLQELTGATPFRLNARFEGYRLVTAEATIDLIPLHPDGIEADILRRDYSVNTLLLPGSVFNAGGVSSARELQAQVRCHPAAWDDLSSRTLRMTSRASLAEDPLRVLRGYHMVARWGMSVEPATREAWQSLAGRVLDPAGERVHEALLRWFAVPPVAALRLAAEDGVLWELFPELQATVGCDQLGYHHLDVWEHTLLALLRLDEIRTALPPELAEFAPQLVAAWDAPVAGSASAGTLTRLALLLHDVAKPPTRAVRPDGRPSFHGHQDIGPRMMQPVLERLRFSNSEIEFTLLLMREHMRLGYYSEPSRLSPKLVYRYLRSLGPATPLMVLHTLADCAATGGPLADGSWERHVHAARLVLEHFYAADSVAAPPLLLDGAAIMALTGLRPGKLVGQLKAALLEATAAGEVTDVDQAEEFVAAELLRLRANQDPLTEDVSVDG